MQHGFSCFRLLSAVSEEFQVLNAKHYHGNELCTDLKTCAAGYENGNELSCTRRGGDLDHNIGFES